MKTLALKEVQTMTSPLQTANSVNVSFILSNLLPLLSSNLLALLQEGPNVLTTFQIHLEGAQIARNQISRVLPVKEG